LRKELDAMTRVKIQVLIAISCLVVFWIKQIYFHPVLPTTSSYSLSYRIASTNQSYENQSTVQFPSNPHDFSRLFDNHTTHQCGPLAFSSAPFVLKESDPIKQAPHKFYRLPVFDVSSEDFGINSTSKGGVALFKDAYIASRHVSVFDCEHVFFPGGCIGGKTDLSKIYQNSAGIQSAMDGQKKTINLDLVIAIGQFWGEAFYHHMIEDLPRVAMIIDFLALHPHARLLLYQPSTHTMALYHLLGIHESQMVYYDPHQVYFAHHVLVPTATTCGRGNAHALRAVRDRMVAAIPRVMGSELRQFRAAHGIADDNDGDDDNNSDINSNNNDDNSDSNSNDSSNSTMSSSTLSTKSSTSMSCVIVVQDRSPSDQRSVINHRELVHQLKDEVQNQVHSNKQVHNHRQKQSRCVVLEFPATASTTDAILTHYLADIIIGPHGAGLSWSIVTRPGAKLIELHPYLGNYGGEGINYCHQATAQYLGMTSILLQEETGDAYHPLSVNVTKVMVATRFLIRVLETFRKQV
jgi:hypothetical protein